MAKRFSHAITWLRFPLIFFIIMLHCYSVQKIQGVHELYFHTIYPTAIWLGETGVPAFFFISGYLFFRSKNSYFTKIKKRIRTLLIPYLLWNFLLLILYIVVYAIGYPQEINNRSIEEYNITDYIRLFWDRGSYDNGNFVPLLCPLWYIRNLLIMSILSPIFKYIIKYFREIFLLIITVWWLITFHNAFIQQTILFFCLGAYFSILDMNPLGIIIKYKSLFLSLFIVFATGDIVSHVAIDTPINLQIHRLSLIFNIPILFLLADYGVRHGYSNELFPKIAFIVFCIHYPIVVILRKLCIAQFSYASDITHILLYIVCVIISTLLSIVFYLILDKKLYSVKNILSGKR